MSVSSLICTGWTFLHVILPGQSSSSSSTCTQPLLSTAGLRHGCKDLLKPSTVSLFLTDLPQPFLSDLNVANHFSSGPLTLQKRLRACWIFLVLFIIFLAPSRALGELSWPITGYFSLSFRK